MPCSRCGQEVYPLYSIPTKVSRVTHKIAHLEWSCRDCLTPKEKFLLALRDYNLQQLAKKGPETISLEEFLEVKRKAEFECPLGIDNLGTCDGYLCPSKPKPKCAYGKCEWDPETCRGPSAGCYGDYYYECLEALKARGVLRKVIRGEIKPKGFIIRL